MWERFKRLIRSIVGFFISSAEDPELILQQNIRDMNDQVPKMNQNIALIKANVTLLERESSKLKKQEVDLLSKIKVADAMEQFEVAGIDQTHDEMIRKINEEAAINEAKLEMALTNVDIDSIKIEEEAEKIRANELVQQIKKEMEGKGS
jgi:phage shock protein A